MPAIRKQTAPARLSELRERAEPKQIEKNRSRNQRPHTWPVPVPLPGLVQIVLDTGKQISVKINDGETFALFCQKVNLDGFFEIKNERLRRWIPPHRISEIRITD